MGVVLKNIAVRFVDAIFHQHLLNTFSYATDRLCCYFATVTDSGGASITSRNSLWQWELLDKGGVNDSGMEFIFM